MYPFVCTYIMSLVIAGNTYCLQAGASVKVETLNLVFLGDSITYDGLLSSRNTQSPPVVCVDELRRQLRGTSVIFANEGHCGHTTVDFLPSTATDYPLAVEHGRDMLAHNGGRLVFFNHAWNQRQC